MEPGKPSRR